MSELEVEESWEAEIGALLGALPEVDPPDGFIAAALDHRPLGAMRTLAGLCLAVVIAAGGSLVVGAGGGRIIPEIEDLSQRHVAAAAGHGRGTDEVDIAADADPGPTPEDAVGEGSPGPSASLVSRGYERAAMLDSAELRQAVYARNGDVVSIFEAAGALDWDELPESGRTTLGDTEAWVDEDRAITIVETGDGMVAIVGLSPDEVRDLLVDLPTEAPAFTRRVDELATALARQLGFPG